LICFRVFSHSGLAGTVAQGFAFGTGSAIARTAVDSVMGGGRQEAAPVGPTASPAVSSIGSGACDIDKQAFASCMQANNFDARSCEFFFEALNTCQANNRA
jgi:hypothetical protein